MRSTTLLALLLLLTATLLVASPPAAAEGCSETIQWWCHDNTVPEARMFCMLWVDVAGGTCVQGHESLIETPI